MNPSDKLTVKGGTQILNTPSGTPVTGLAALSIVAREDSTITACTGTTSSGAAYNFFSTLNWGTLKNGDVLFAPDGYLITSITYTSGSLLLNKA